jgi:hypothetical protein
MIWTRTKPTQTGWYFYREPGKNLDKRMEAWVFTSGKFIVSPAWADALHRNGADQRL